MRATITPFAAWSRPCAYAWLAANGFAAPPEAATLWRSLALALGFGVLAAAGLWGFVRVWSSGAVRRRALELGHLAWLAALPWLVDAATTTLAAVGLVAWHGALFAEAALAASGALGRDRLAAARGRAWGVAFLSVPALAAVWPWVAASGSFVLLGAAMAFALVEMLAPRATVARATAAPSGPPITLRSDRALAFSLLALPAAFAFLGLLAHAVVAADAPSLVPLAIAGAGIALGAHLAGRWSDGRIETGWIPLGTSLQVLGCLVWWFLPTGFGGAACAFAVAFGLGFVLLPLDVLLRWRGPRATAPWIAWGAFGGAGLGFALGVLAGLASDGALPVLLAAMGGLAILGTIVALRLLPSAFLRAAAWLVTHTIYRMRVLGAEHVPARGACVLAPNHVSFADAMFVLAATDRSVRFLAEEEQFASRVFGPLLRMNRAIPISAKGGPRRILKALRDAGDELDRGSVVCLFPEGQITRTGAMQPFRRGLERLVRGRDAVIVPVHLDRVWGSIFSYSGARFFWKLPEEVPYRVTVSFGAPLPPDTPVSVVRDAVQELSQRASEERRPHAKPLHEAFVRRVRRAPWRLLLVDASGRRLRRWQALVGALALARHLRRRWCDQERVGVLLPPSAAGALVNAAVSFAGRTVCNLNYTAGDAGLLSAARQAGFQEVLTSRTFLEKAGLALPEGLTPVFLEDEVRALGRLTRLVAALAASCAPVRWLERFAGAARAVRGEDVATVIFSSGSTGDPKGVQLSHFNVTSNVEAVAQVFRLERDDRLLGILPFFHSFGTLSLWFSLTQGVPIVLHANPVDAPTIGSLVRTHGVTILLATPTFLQVYLRRIEGEDFGSLRLVLAGAEKLSEQLARAFEERFGVRPLEGYGTTECSPVVATSIPSHRERGFYQRGWRPGFVGPPLPGVALRILDPDSGERLGPNAAGLLQVKGPNVMLGYLGRDDLTRKVLRDGWYETGDVAMLDEEGFLRITDRLSRFSKIGGEMIPHGTIEEALHRAYDAQDGEARFCVTAVPDAKKGERLVVLHLLGASFHPEPLLEALRTQGLANLFLPRPDAFFPIDEIPRLGTGKTDLRALRRIAEERAGAP